MLVVLTTPWPAGWQELSPCRVRFEPVVRRLLGLAARTQGLSLKVSLCCFEDRAGVGCYPYPRKVIFEKRNGAWRCRGQRGASAEGSPARPRPRDVCWFNWTTGSAEGSLDVGLVGVRRAESRSRGVHGRFPCFDCIPSRTRRRTRGLPLGARTRRRIRTCRATNPAATIPTSSSSGGSADGRTTHERGRSRLGHERRTKMNLEPNS